MASRRLNAAARGEPNRQRILAAVAASPGITFQGLVRASGVASGTCSHHRTVLLRQARLVERRHGIACHYFLPDQRSDVLAILEAEAGLKAVADVLRRSPGIIQGEVIASFPAWPRSTVQHRLRRLQEAGIVQAVPYGKRALAYTMAVA